MWSPALDIAALCLSLWPASDLHFNLHHATAHTRKLQFVKVGCIDMLFLFIVSGISPNPQGILPTWDWAKLTLKLSLCD